MKKTLFVSLFYMVTLLYGQKQALIVGIPSHFSNGGIQLDMANMKALFESSGFNVTILSDATTTDLRDQLKSYQNLANDDSFVFYYTGHGGQIDDTNNDEEDGKDEVLVLANHDSSTGEGLFVDDEMFLLLSKIPAKRFVFFDSCHSGTAFKSMNDYQVKSKGYLRHFKGAGVREPSQSVKNSIFFLGAAQDSQQSIATSNGSVFTLALNDGLKHKKADINSDGEVTFNELLSFTEEDIKQQLEGSPAVFTPAMHGDKNILKQDVFKAMEDKISTLEIGLDQLIQDSEARVINVKHKKMYREDDTIKLRFNAGNQDKYLSVVLVDSKEITVLYPNKFEPNAKRFQAKVDFPLDVSSKFEVYAMKPYGRTVIYTLLSDSPLNLYNDTKGAAFTTEPLNTHSSKSLRDIGKNASFNNMLIGKAVFEVKKGY